MDPVTHSLMGAAIAAAWRRRVVLAMPAALIGANIPDIDVFSYFDGEYAALAFRRGLTHGPLALLLLAALTVLVLLGWDRFVRRRRDPDAGPARVLPLFAVSAAAVVTHPLLDWMNTYGIRWLAPFDSRWYYGDSLFIIDPWIWLMLGVPLFLAHSVRRSGAVAWGVVAAAASALVLLSGMVPPAARLVWLLVLAGAIAARTMRPAAALHARASPLARTGLALAAAYIGGMVAADASARRQVAAHALEYGITPVDVMVAPVPAHPLRAEVVVADGHAYWFGRFSWLAARRVSLTPRPVPAGDLSDDIVAAAAAVPEARDFLRWSRFPVVDSRPEGDGYVVRFGDARYFEGRAGGLGGVTVRLDGSLRPPAADE
jgi:inner membrane protein